MADYYIVMRVNRWEDMEFGISHLAGLPVKASRPDDGSVGCLWVFDDLEKAEAFADEYSPPATVLVANLTSSAAAEA